MRKRTVWVVGGMVCALFALLVTGQVWSGLQDPGDPPGEMSMEEMMRKWQELNAKGPEHDEFQKMVGRWDVVMRSWTAPETEPMRSEGTADFRLILDGRYIEQKFKYDFMGQTYEGLGIEGYDRIKKKYVSVWMDNAGTGIFMNVGTVDESGKIRTYHGKMDDPFTGQKDKVVKSIGRMISDDHVVFEMYDVRPDVGEFKTMEIEYRRRK